MARATSVVLLASGVLLLLTWLVSPASSAPQVNRVAVVPDTGVAALPSELLDVNREVDRLRARLDRDVGYPEPARDPFHFGSRARVEHTAPMATSDTTAEPAVIEPSWPTLVAILASDSGGPLQAALSDAADGVQILEAGATIGTFTVTDVTADAVALADPVSGQSVRLSLHSLVQ